ncbi:MAG: hypothetical protein LBG58_09840 [Planctomycetaceae bacterium]|jgi:hypothetical protein|nr:hypothetical protein [Planctomycetaceae bacterium]
MEDMIIGVIFYKCFVAKQYGEYKKLRFVHLQERKKSDANLNFPHFLESADNYNEPKKQDNGGEH